MLLASAVRFLDLALTVTAGAVILSWVSDVNKLEGCRGGRVPWKTSYLSSVAALEMVLSLGLFMSPAVVPLSVVVGMDIVNVATVIVLISLDADTRAKGGCLDAASAGDWRLKGYTAFASAGAALLALKVFLSAIVVDFSSAA